MGDARRRKLAGSRIPRFATPHTQRALTKLVVPAGPGMPPREVGLEALAVAETVRRRVREHLVRAAAGGRIEDLLGAIETVGAECKTLFEDALAAAQSANAGHRADMERVECRRGCAFCCHVDVDVTPLEAIRLAEHQRVAGHGPPAAASARYAPCPLLSDSACTAYGMRPFACRSLFSPDAKACEAGFTTAATVFVPSLNWPRFIACGYITGELAALADLGLASHLVELRQALALLLGDPTALPRWLNRADVFPRRGAVAAP
jgi:hypothetical protein